MTNNRRYLTILNFIKNLINPLLSRRREERSNAVIYARADHGISRSQISENALKVLRRLKQSGYQAYLVGGCVRDLLLGIEPKDFDVVTNARPEQVKEVFRNCRLIGRRFRLAHVYFGREIIEVATFRGTSDNADDSIARVSEEGRLLRDNVYGTIEEDVWRRDFTINALYYNIEDFSVVDFVGGMADHRAGQLKLIGDAEKRYREDPVRMLRAVRFATKLGFTIHPDCERPIGDMAELVGDVPAARLYDEALKLFMGGKAVQTFENLRHHNLFRVLFPETDKALGQELEGFPLTFLMRALDNTDKRLSEGKTVTPYFLMAALLWEPVRLRANQLMNEGQNDILAYQEASAEIVSKQVKYISLPRRITQPMRELWTMQPRFFRRSGSRPARLLTHPRFRAAYDFMLLRSETGDVDKSVAQWWQQFQDADENIRRKMTRASSTAGGGRKRRPRRRSRPTAEKGSNEIINPSS